MTMRCLLVPYPRLHSYPTLPAWPSCSLSPTFPPQRLLCISKGVEEKDLKILNNVNGVLRPVRLGRVQASKREGKDVCQVWSQRGHVNNMIARTWAPTAWQGGYCVRAAVKGGLGFWIRT